MHRTVGGVIARHFVLLAGAIVIARSVGCTPRTSSTRSDRDFFGLKAPYWRSCRGGPACRATRVEESHDDRDCSRSVRALYFSKYLRLVILGAALIGIAGRHCGPTSFRRQHQLRRCPKRISDDRRIGPWRVTQTTRSLRRSVVVPWSVLYCGSGQWLAPMLFFGRDSVFVQQGAFFELS